MEIVLWSILITNSAWPEHELSDPRLVESAEKIEKSRNHAAGQGCPGSSLDTL